MLKRYSVVEASTAEEAIGKFADHDIGIELLIADVTLPVSSGVQVALRLRQENPSLPVILTSGYPVSSWSARDASDFHQLQPDSMIVLHKPFNAPSLLNSVSELMGEKASGAA
jgi:two-component system cell cycle sensor histidine kinase/response regulator CckA